MANHDFENDSLFNDRWLEDCLGSLTSDRAIIPGTGNALTRLRERHRARRIAMRRWTWTSAGLAAAGIAVFLVPTARACAEQPGACAQKVWRTVSADNGVHYRVTSQSAGAPPIVTHPPAETSPAPVLLSQLKPPAKPVVKFGTPAAFKEIGSPAAPITLEAYTDYECPWCAVFFRNIVPQIMEQYVRTGKVKFVHRDFPLAQHPYARLAARFANAAGEIGKYEAVANQIFATQDSWSKTGDIDAEVTKVLPPGDMQRVRALIKTDDRLDDTVISDVAMGTNTDHLTSTPTVIVVSGNRREVIANAATLPFSVWKSYLDTRLAGLAAR